MKILTLIPSYRPRIDRLAAIVSELSTVSHVYIFSPERSVSQLATWIECDQNVKENLVFEPRRFLQRIDTNYYDYVFYNEDDISVTGEQLKKLIEIQRTLPDTMSVGPIRYEVLNGKRMFIDLHPAHSVHTGGNGSSDIIRWKNQTYFQPWNVHSGNFLLSSRQLKSLMETNRFDTFFGEHNIRYCGCLESGATSVYRSLTKVVPIEYDSFCVEHLATKYGSVPNTPSDSELQTLLK